uniref:ZM domain-containing protein n=1 Tax=Parastrongyloides trichosuri TaxID=131310 RepID=A0A0N5A736_PARTI
MQNNYDFPDHLNQSSRFNKHGDKFEYSNQMTSEYYHEMETFLPNDMEIEDDYPNLMRCDGFISSTHQQNSQKTQQHNLHPYNSSRNVGMNKDFHKQDNNRNDSQQNNNFYSNPNTFIPKKKPFPEMPSDSNRRGNMVYRDQNTNFQQNNWQPINEDSIHPRSSNNSKVQLNRIVTTQSKVDRVNIKDDNNVEYRDKVNNIQPVSKVQSVVQLMNKLEKSFDLGPNLKNKRLSNAGMNKDIQKQKSLPYPLDFDDDRDQNSRANSETSSTTKGKVANTVKKLQDKLQTNIKSIGETQQKKSLVQFNNNRSSDNLSIVKERNDILDSLPEPLSSEASEISNELKRLSTESDYIKETLPEDPPKKKIEQHISQTLSKNMAIEAKMLMQYFQKRRPLLNFLGVGLSDQLWEQVNSLPSKTVKLVYLEEMGSSNNIMKQKEQPRLSKRLSIRSSIRQDPRKLALKKKLLQTKSDNQNVTSNYSKIDKSLKKNSKDGLKKKIPTLNDYSSNHNDDELKRNYIHNHQNVNAQYLNDFSPKQQNNFDNNFEEECQEKHDIEYVDHSKKDYYMDFNIIHEDQSNYDDEKQVMEDGRNCFDNSGTLQSIDTKTGRFVKKSAAALIAKRQAHSVESPTNPPMKSNSSSSIASRHSNQNTIKNHNQEEVDHIERYQKDLWNENKINSKGYSYNIGDKNGKLLNASMGQRQHLRSVKSVDHLLFEDNHINQNIYEDNEIPDYDPRITKTSSYQQLLHDDYENPQDMEQIEMPRIPPHKSHFKQPPLSKSSNNHYQQQYNEEYSNNQFLYTGARPFIPKQAPIPPNMNDYPENTLRDKKSMTVDSRPKKGTWRLYGSLGKLFKKRAAIRL